MVQPASSRQIRHRDVLRASSCPRSRPNTTSTCLSMGRRTTFESPDERLHAVRRARLHLEKPCAARTTCIVYQLGNAPCHDYMWAYLVRYPGLVVLHDGQLHHARGRMLLQRWQPRRDDYRREFRFNHPDANPTVAELGAVGLAGIADLSVADAAYRRRVQPVRARA